jgi:hypothetical protein
MNCRLEAALVRLHAQDATLTSLHLRWNGISDAGAASLADALHVNRTLTSLYLDYNDIGEAGAASLAGALHVNHTLTTLDLEWNRIGGAGAASLADALHHNTTLASLSLARNEIGAAGAASLASALRVNRTLTSLHLEWNGIGDAGALAVARALRAQPNLHTLSWELRLATVLAAELSSDERQLYDAALLAHWRRRRRRGQSKLTWLLGTSHTLAGCTNPSPLAALSSSAMWDRQLVCELFEWSGDAGVPLVAAERTPAPGSDAKRRRSRRLQGLSSVTT